MADSNRQSVYINPKKQLAQITGKLPSLQSSVSRKNLVSRLETTGSK
jgi:hypothetical protein